MIGNRETHASDRQSFQIQILTEVIFFAIHSLQIFKMLINNVIKLIINLICFFIILASIFFYNCVSCSTILSRKYRI